MRKSVLGMAIAVAVGILYWGTWASSEIATTPAAGGCCAAGGEMKCDMDGSFEGEMTLMPEGAMTRPLTSARDGASACPMMMAGTAIKVIEIRNGVRMEWTASDTATVAALRSQARRMAAMSVSQGTTPRATPRPATRPATPPAADVYTCPMHPEVTSGAPGRCPKCGMNLVIKSRGGN